MVEELERKRHPESYFGPKKGKNSSLKGTTLHKYIESKQGSPVKRVESKGAVGMPVNGIEATVMRILEENKHNINPKKLKKDHKIIETLVKKFNVHIHTKNLLKEDPEYLEELNDEINSRLEYMRTGKTLLFEPGITTRPVSRVDTARTKNK